MKVHIRKRKQSKGGMISLYLEIYYGTTTLPNGKLKTNRKYEYYDMFTYPNPQTITQRNHNKEVERSIEAIRSQRLIDLLNGVNSIPSSSINKLNFINFFNEEKEKKKQSDGNYGNWDSAYKHLIAYKGENIQFKDINENFCEGFKLYLQNDAITKSDQKLSSSSVASYFAKFRACIKIAVKKKYLNYNPAEDVKTPVVESERSYLTLEELKSLITTDCRYDVLKRAFLFACLTGLRWSDINNLTWDKFRRDEKNWKIVFNQQKTKGLEHHNINNQALEFIGDIQQGNGKVFVGLKYSSYFNLELARWMLKAGITKPITFHCSRHTYAIIMANSGTPLLVVSKLLGHKNFKTTQIYAKIIDQTLVDATNNFPSLEI